MSESLRLSVPDLASAEGASAFFRVADAARDVDGYDPFNEQARLDVASGHRTPIVATVSSTDALWQPDAHVVGAAIVGGAELDLVIDPVFRGKGYGAVAASGLLPHLHGPVTAWSHGDHPAARALAPRFGFEPVRTLLQLRLAPLGSLSEDGGAGHGDGISIDAFRPGIDDAEWVSLNARVFAKHPEQGGITLDDLRAREAESWFEPGDFLVARGPDGRMVGYNWLKLEPGDGNGEVYVIGVDATGAGRGLGRRLMRAGLDRLSQRGRVSATLYVEADNEAAVHLYRSLGFADHTVDVQYRREQSSSSGQ
jgi:mycothiol synthase